MTDEMDTDRATLELSRRKVLGSMAIMGAAGAGAGAGTWAYFQDEASLDGNTISAGKLSLGEVQSEPFEIEDVYPEMDPRTASIEVAEEADNIEDDVVLDIGYEIVDNGDNLAQQLEAVVSYNNELHNSNINSLDGSVDEGLDRPNDNGASVEFEITWPDPVNDSSEWEESQVEMNVHFLLRQSGADPLTV